MMAVMGLADPFVLADAPKVEVKIAKLDALKDLIKQHKGKVVVVDFWADT
jgi:hypothetical protein